ncbi:uncharacterized protein LOC112347431 isoform X2 [Selaginella moellendorffii]|uniref:uncharacterized protein LOC112347431 isoform X2 n=1 Tax=Selaginella moellendorffii TaxID=88036 RepID=UPI000D1C298B|nr:uncharacterized protein LOC112347431 isoform X2 [Selaginella moellendorffii]|eukprot:XP_024534029.1 uncharacterized protein LOC112347431 isoform X2 [Selaginella moellendorffii]
MSRERTGRKEEQQWGEKFFLYNWYLGRAVAARQLLQQQRCQSISFKLLAGVGAASWVSLWSQVGCNATSVSELETRTTRSAPSVAAEKRAEKKRKKNKEEEKDMEENLVACDDDEASPTCAMTMGLLLQESGGVTAESLVVTPRKRASASASAALRSAFFCFGFVRVDGPSKKRGVRVLRPDLARNATVTLLISFCLEGSSRFVIRDKLFSTRTRKNARC